MRIRPLMLLTLFACAAVAAARTATFQQRLDEFRARAELARIKARLPDHDAAVQKFPTPEVTLVPVLALPGKEVTVTAKGVIPRGAFAAFDCDGLRVRDLKTTATSVTAKVTQPVPFSLPRPCRLHVVSPISGADRKLRAVIPAGYRWELHLDNGMTALLREDALGGMHATFRDGEQELGTRAMWPEWGEGRSWKARILPVNGEDNARTRSWETTPDGQERNRIEAQRSALAERINHECPRQTGPDLQACYRELRAQSDALKPRLEELEKNGALWMNAHPAGCGAVELDADEKGNVSGKALRCLPDGKDAAVTGKMVADPAPFVPPPPPAQEMRSPERTAGKR